MRNILPGGKNDSDDRFYTRYNKLIIEKYERTQWFYDHQHLIRFPKLREIFFMLAGGQPTKHIGG